MGPATGGSLGTCQNAKNLLGVGLFAKPADGGVAKISILETPPRLQTLPGITYVIPDFVLGVGLFANTPILKVDSTVKSSKIDLTSHFGEKRSFSSLHGI